MIETGLRIRFVKKAHLNATPTVRVNTQTGRMRVSAPAATAFDLVRYPEHCGFLTNVATVLHDLAEQLDGGDLVRVAELERSQTGSRARRRASSRSTRPRP